MSFVDPDTEIGGPRGRFPETRHSAILDLAARDEGARSRACDALLSSYWKPVYKYIRLKWKKSNEDAKDLTQSFFARAFEKEFFSAYDPDRGSFRTYLRTCLDAFVANESKFASRRKRSADAPLLSLDFATAEGELREHQIPSGESLDDYFHREWVRNLFVLAVEALRQECTSREKLVQFQLFERYVLEASGGQPSYDQLASEFAISTAAVTNYLAAMRRKFRQVVLAALREMTADEREFRNEARAVLGIEV
jgi:RNA polymerase sigma factor (sigma-70 family)